MVEKTVVEKSVVEKSVVEKTALICLRQFKAGMFLLSFVGHTPLALKQRDVIFMNNCY